MTARERASDRAARRVRQDLTIVGQEIRQARMSAGLTQAALSRAAGVSRHQVRQAEDAERANHELVAVARVAAAAGLDARLRVFPAGPPTRDAAHVALLERFRIRLAPSWRWRIEVPVGPPDDPRRWDVVIGMASVSIANEAETRLYDVQAQSRKALGKMVGGSIDRLILLVADTHHNRLVLRQARELLRGDFPLDTRTVMAAVCAGQDPGANGIVVI